MWPLLIACSTPPRVDQITPAVTAMTPPWTEMGLPPVDAVRISRADTLVVELAADDVAPWSSALEANGWARDVDLEGRGGMHGSRWIQGDRTLMLGVIAHDDRVTVSLAETTP